MTLLQLFDGMILSLMILLALLGMVMTAAFIITSWIQVDQHEPWDDDA